MHDLPKLQRLRNPKANQDKEIWKPSWHCFCCHDTGIVRRPELVIEDYNDVEDLAVVCQKPGCSAGAHLIGMELDERFTSAICATLDAICREDWQRTVEQKFANIQALAKKMQMSGTCARTANDDREVQQRKEEIESISHEQWLAMTNDYLGSDA